MEGIYEWIRNITYYLIFMTVASNLLPNKKYEKYFHLFAGMVLVVLVLKPFMGGLRLDDKLAYYFESISFQKEASELTDKLSEMEGTRLNSVVSQYEEAVDNDLKTMAESSGFVCEKADAGIDADENKKTFGHVVSVSLTLAPDNSGKGEETKEKSAVQPIKPVRIETGRVSEEVSETAGGANTAGKNHGERQKENSALAGLRKRISEYYDLEERDIEIQLENE